VGEGRGPDGAKTIIPPSPNQIGGVSEVKTERAIGFYTSQGPIQDQKNPIKFSDFQRAVKKINKSE
jgi:hypothetical protein